MTGKELFEQLKKTVTPMELMEAFDDAVLEWGVGWSHHNNGDLYEEDLYDFGRENYSEEAWDDVLNQYGKDEIGAKYDWEAEDYEEFSELMKDYMDS